MVDLRNVEEKKTLSAVMRVRQPAAIVLATEQTNPLPTVLRTLFEAARDGRQELVLGRRKLVLHPDSRVHLLTWGSQSWDENDAKDLFDGWDPLDEFDIEPAC